MRRTAWWFLLCVFLISWWLVAPPPSTWLDRVYGEGVYPVIAGVLVSLTGSVAFPVTPVVLAALLVWFVLHVTLGRRRHRVPAWRWLWRGVVTAATLYALFIVLWGANYGRTPVETRLGLSATPPTPAETLALANDVSSLLRQDAQAPEVQAEVWATDLSAGQRSLQRFTEGLEHHLVTLPRYIKHTPSGFLIFTGGATGITIPWTLEAYVDRALPYPVALGTALHETAHVAGYAGEAEADFVAALAGLTSSNRSVRYGAALLVFLRAAQTLPPERYAALFKALPARAQADITAYSFAYRRYSAPNLVALLQTRFYDSYLRTQRVGAGIADYDRALTLLLAAKREGLLTFGPGKVRFSSARPR